MREAFDELKELRAMIGKYYALKSYEDLKHIIDNDFEKPNSVINPQYLAFLKEKADAKVCFHHLESQANKTFSESGSEWVLYIEMIDRKITKESDPEFWL